MFEFELKVFLVCHYKYEVKLKCDRITAIYEMKRKTGVLRMCGNSLCNTAIKRGRDSEREIEQTVK